jgi:hypothetical protein
MSQEQCPGQLRLWPKFHGCPVCESDRLALGHYQNERSLVAPYSAEDLVRHLGSCELESWEWELWVDPFEEPF